MEQRIRNLWPALNTQQIADQLGIPESVVYNVLFCGMSWVQSDDLYSETFDQTMNRVSWTPACVRHLVEGAA